ncbi:hypothetical protein ACIUWV_26615 [Pseudomonas aeruginosa]
MTNELTDVRCSCGDEYPADSYDAGFIAGSGMCQNCDAALPPKDICTCPSGDSSLRHPCPAHPASVDLAGVAANLTFINGRPAMCGCQVEYSSGGGEYSDVIDVTLCAKHSGSAILDLVATNRIALTPEYEGQWHADLYLDREIPLAKAEGATPAEAVLALMSAERIDPEQESVGQAGGDERAAFFKHLIGRHPAHETEIVRVVEHNHAAWKAWQARADLAQPSPTLPPFAEKVLAKLRRFYDCAEDFESGGVDIGRHWLDLLTQLGLLNRVQRSPALWEISQQGEDLLGTPHPSPAQAEKAEAERQEVVDFNPYRYHAEKIRQRADGAASAYEAGRSALGYMEDIAESALIVRNGLDELSAQHERIVGALRAERDGAIKLLGQSVWQKIERLTQERDAALAEVERLRESKGDPSGSFDRCMKMMYERDENAKRLDAALARVAELDKQCRDDVARALGLLPSQERGFAWSYLLASIKSCVKASEDAAQAQHSVPAYVSYTTRPAESLAGIALRQLKDESRWVEIRDINAHAFPDMQSHSYYPAGTVIKLLAAAPGKEGL